MTLMKASSESNICDGYMNQGKSKAVSVSSRVKFLLAKEIKMNVSGDESLQSTNSRRRFMRRGSRSPSMMHAALSVQSMGDLLSIDYSLSSQPCSLHRNGNRSDSLTSMNELNTSFSSLQAVDSSTKISKFNGLDA